MRTFFAFLFLLSTIGLSAQSEFDKAVQTDRFSTKTKKKLKVFYKSGIERTLKTENTNANALVAKAKKYIGMKHCMGGDGSKNCIDCSGLLFATFKDVGIKLGFHGSQEMARYGTIISDKNKLKKGDLVFFVNTYSTSKVITHSGIMVSKTEWIHVSSKKGVEVIKLNSPYYWNKYFLYGTRVF